MKNSEKLQASIKSTPQRTCVACRRTVPKREMVRLVLTPDGIVEVDTTGKKAGRGAYLCAVIECWNTGIKGGRLERALRATLSEDNCTQLIDYGSNLVMADNRIKRGN